MTWSIGLSENRTEVEETQLGYAKNPWLRPLVSTTSELQCYSQGEKAGISQILSVISLAINDKALKLKKRSWDLSHMDGLIHWIQDRGARVEQTETGPNQNVWLHASKPCLS